MLFCHTNNGFLPNCFHPSDPDGRFQPLVRKSTYLYQTESEKKWMNLPPIIIVSLWIDDKLLCQKWHTPSQFFNYFFQLSSTLFVVCQGVKKIVQQNATNQTWMFWLANFQGKFGWVNQSFSSADDIFSAPEVHPTTQTPIKKLSVQEMQNKWYMWIGRCQPGFVRKARKGIM